MKRAGKLTTTVVTIFAVVFFDTALSGQELASPSEALGRVTFPISCSAAVQRPFERGVALLHSFWYSESIKTFIEVSRSDAGCAMAYWGIAMSLWYQLSSPPDPLSLRQGWDAIKKAKAAAAKTQRERDFIGAAEAFFKDAEKFDHRTRVVAYERAMGQVYLRYPQDREAAAFYALALLAAVDPNDRTYRKQKKAGEIAAKVRAGNPNHPGGIHYVMHAYAYPALARHALPAAQQYVRLAPPIPHALHMPSHIFALMGMWPETIQSNIAAAAAEKSRGHLGSELHALDYLFYAYLQQARDAEAASVLDETRQIATRLVSTRSAFGRAAAGFVLAAIEARWAIERGHWSEAASIEPHPSRFAPTEAMIYFARAIGASRSNNTVQARADVDKLKAIRNSLTKANDSNWTKHIEIQLRAAEAWTALAEGKDDEAITLMRAAADLEDSSERQDITAGPIRSARDLFGDMFLELHQPAQAVREYSTSLRVLPNRFRSLYGVARAAELIGDLTTAKRYYKKLLVVASSGSERTELSHAKEFLYRQAMRKKLGRIELPQVSWTPR